jgi:putative pyruvate formate lyase activating enzyme
MGVEELARTLVCLQREKGIHNVNFVTPDHVLPHCMALVRRLRRLGCKMPVLYNLSGYQSLESLRLMEPCADIYLPDFKYSDRDLAARLSRCPDYPSVALEAISEMIRQKGFLFPLEEDSDGRPIPAQRGVLVRHLILPSQVRNSLDALTMLFVEFGKDLPLSLMSQYTPIKRPSAISGLDRPLLPDEFHKVIEHALQLGFRNLFVQYPEEMDPSDRPFVPDFTRPRPFAGNI